MKRFIFTILLLTCGFSIMYSQQTKSTTSIFEDKFVKYEMVNETGAILWIKLKDNKNCFFVQQKNYQVGGNGTTSWKTFPRDGEMIEFFGIYQNGQFDSSDLMKNLIAGYFDYYHQNKETVFKKGLFASYY